MTPMSEERWKEIRHTATMYGNDALSEEDFNAVLDEITRLRDVPPEVAAAMERHAAHVESENGPTSSPYARPRGGLTAEWLMDQELIAAHFTALFQKGA